MWLVLSYITLIIDGVSNYGDKNYKKSEVAEYIYIYIEYITKFFQNNIIQLFIENFYHRHGQQK